MGSEEGQGLIFEASEGEFALDSSKLREVSQAGMWSVSSCKTGYGVESVVDGSTETYWQSDGPQPHLLTVSFPRKTPLAAVAIYVDFKADESYTPSKISIRAGSGPSQLNEVAQWMLEAEPSGWLTKSLVSEPNGPPIPAFILQLAVLQNYQNGRDTHIRQVKVFSPILPSEVSASASSEDSLLGASSGFTSKEMQQYATIR